MFTCTWKTLRLHDRYATRCFKTNSQGSAKGLRPIRGFPRHVRLNIHPEHWRHQISWSMCWTLGSRMTYQKAGKYDMRTHSIWWFG